MKSVSHLIICPQCDCAYYNPGWLPSEIISCERCGAILYNGADTVSEYILPLTLTAAITFIIACCYPVFSVEFHGMQNSVTLYSAMLALTVGNDFLLMPVCLMILFIGAPLFQILLTLWVLLFARFTRPAPAFITAMKMLRWLRPCNRVEVGVVGFLVAAIKLSSLLDVSLGIGGGAFAVSSILMTVVNHHSLQPLWQLLPEKKHQAG